MTESITARARRFARSEADSFVAEHDCSGDDCETCNTVWDAVYQYAFNVFTRIGHAERGIK